jgi:hypothetical protein
MGTEIKSVNPSDFTHTWKITKLLVNNKSGKTKVWYELTTTNTVTNNKNVITDEIVFKSVIDGSFIEFDSLKESDVSGWIKAADPSIEKLNIGTVDKIDQPRTVTKQEVAPPW